MSFGFQFGSLRLLLRLWISAIIPMPLAPIAWENLKELLFLAGSIGGFGNLNGIGQNARFGPIAGISVDGSNNVFVSDIPVNHTIRKISPGSISVTTQASGITVNSSGDTLYVADYNNNMIRKITNILGLLNTGVVTTAIGSSSQSGILLGNLPGSLNNPNSITYSNGGLVFTSNAGLLLSIAL